MIMEEEVEQLKKERDNWKAHHDEQVRSKRRGAKIKDNIIKYWKTRARSLEDQLIKASVMLEDLDKENDS